MPVIRGNQCSLIHSHDLLNKCYLYYIGNGNFKGPLAIDFSDRRIHTRGNNNIRNISHASSKKGLRHGFFPKILPEL